MLSFHALMRVPARPRIDEGKSRALSRHAGVAPRADVLQSATLNNTPAASGKNKPSLLLVSATYAAEENRKKLAALAEHFDLTCVTCTEARAFGLDTQLGGHEQPTGYRLIGLPTIGRPESTTRYLFRGLGKIFSATRFDIVFVEAEPWAWVRWQSWLCKMRHQRSAIFGEFTWENVERSGLKGWIHRLIYRAAAATDDFAITGNRVAKELFSRHGIARDRVLVAPQLGVDEGLFSPVADHGRAEARIREGITPNAFLIGFCGRFVEEKGVLDLIDAVAATRVAEPSRTIELAFLGSGPLMPALSRMAQDRPWLRLLAPRPHSEVAGFMTLLDLFVLPSKPRRSGGTVWEEQFGHVLIEAMSCGVGCIGSTSGAIPDVLGDEKLTFPPGDVRALTGRIVQMLKCPATGPLMRDRVLHHFTNRAVASQWETFILARLSDRCPATR